MFLQEVNRLLTGLNCGKELEAIALPESTTSLSATHGFDLQ
ncbi:beta-ureidopropionase-like protein, partial [Trifolium pratense]